MMDLYQYFDENFIEGNRFNLVMRLAGSCALNNIPIEKCKEFYNQFKSRDDEDRTYLIERTYERVANKEKVITLPKDVDVRGYFGAIKRIDFVKVDDVNQLKNKLIQMQLSNNQSQYIDINSVAVKLNPAIHKEEFAYLLKRKITIRNIKEFDIRAGIDKLSGRIVFPIYNKEGKCIYYVARAINNEIQPRYLNSKLPKHSVVWNYNNINPNEPVIVCEGIINAITVYNYLKIQSVATLGKFLTIQQIIMLSSIKHLILWFDSDVSFKHISRYINQLKADKLEIVPMWKIKDKRDVNDMTCKEAKELYISRIQIPR